MNKAPSATSPPTTKQLRTLVSQSRVRQGTKTAITPIRKASAVKRIWQLLPLQPLFLNVYKYSTNTLNVLIKVHNVFFILSLNSLTASQTRRPQNASVPILPMPGPQRTVAGNAGLHVSVHQFCSCSRPDIIRSIWPPQEGGSRDDKPHRWEPHLRQATGVGILFLDPNS